jgi:hypothetical protein
MLPPSAALSTQLLTEFLAVLSAAPDGRSATQVAAERAARALEAEAAVVLGRDGTVSSIGFPFGHVPMTEISEVIAGRRRRLDVPGAKGCHTAVAPLGGSEPGHLLVARSGDDGFSVDEVSLVRGIARALELTVGAMRTFARGTAPGSGECRAHHDAARAAAPAVNSCRAYSAVSPAGHRCRPSLDAITNGAQELLGDDVAGLRMIDPGDPDSFLLVSSTGLTEELSARTWKAPTETGATGLASLRNRNRGDR